MSSGRVTSLELHALLSLLDQEQELECMAGPDAVSGLRKVVHGYLERPKYLTPVPEPLREELLDLEPRTEIWRPKPSQ